MRRDIALTDPELARRTLELQADRFLPTVPGTESTLYNVRYAIKRLHKDWPRKSPRVLAKIGKGHCEQLCGLRAFELHEEHCLHVHLVTNSWIDINEALVMAKKAGWGRTHVKRIPAEKAIYMGKYLSKEDRAPCLKGWRLWAAFGAWEWTKVKDVKFESEFSMIIRELIATKGRLSYFKRLALADEIYFNRLENSTEA